MTTRNRLNKLERRRPGRVEYDMTWGNEDGTMTDDNGDHVTPEEWRRRHPGRTLIQLTWGDEVDE